LCGGQINDLVWAVRPAGSSGLGLFATRRLARGETVLTELPLFVTRAQAEPLLAARENLEDLQRLPVELRAAVLDLHDPGHRDTVTNGELEGEAEDAVRLARILEANGLEYDLGELEPALEGAVETRLYRALSRINHSCRPNVLVISAGGAGRQVVVRTAATVGKGEQLLFKYVGGLGSREGRRRELWQQWHFVCHCTVCSLPEGESRRNDQHREIISAFLAESPEEVGWAAALDRLARGLEVLTLCHGLQEEALLPLGEVLLDCFRWSAISRRLGPPGAEGLQDREGDPQVLRSLSSLHRDALLSFPQGRHAPGRQGDRAEEGAGGGGDGRQGGGRGGGPGGQAGDALQGLDVMCCLLVFGAFL
jgi:hypothetical protein